MSTFSQNLRSLLRVAGVGRDGGMENTQEAVAKEAPGCQWPQEGGPRGRHRREGTSQSLVLSPQCKPHQTLGCPRGHRGPQVEDRVSAQVLCLQSELIKPVQGPQRELPGGPLP